MATEKKQQECERSWEKKRKNGVQGPLKAPGRGQGQIPARVSGEGNLLFA